MSLIDWLCLAPLRLKQWWERWNADDLRRHRCEAEGHLMLVGFPERVYDRDIAITKRRCKCGRSWSVLHEPYTRRRVP